ncbi:MAG: aldose 1-epimerase family protein [Winogradskyella sp.]|nr:aldose 1-epimerase family protein [Winogradskyella sp.]
MNDLLNVDIKSEGAELCSLSSIKNNTEFMWQADPNIWGSHAPNLFPIIGMLKDNCYVYNGKAFPMTKHGFVRNNKNFTITKTSETDISFQLNSDSDSELYKMYPFLFEFVISYKLTDNILSIHHKVNNLDNKPIYFSIGGHPAFNCPLYSDENYTDYSLEFEKAERSESHLLNNASGLVTSNTKPVFTDDHNINLNGSLFNEDALIFKDLKSRKVILTHNKKGPVLAVTFKDFPFLGIWAKPNAPYVCIEPWLGIADSETTNQKIETKEGIIALDVGKTFTASYSIEIAKRHLV